jgi:hypothetical protein
VYLESKYSSALAALALAIALCGCTSGTFDASTLFSKPIDLLGSKSGYTYSQLGEARQDRRITANDLVDANGACPTPAPPEQTQSAPGNPGASPAASPGAASLLGGGVAIGMSECDVVSRVGQPTTVNLGQSPNGDRATVLTFASGPRPGVYRFVGGRLKEMDRVDEPPPPPQTAKKKPAKPTKSNDAT